MRAVKFMRRGGEGIDSKGAGEAGNLSKGLHRIGMKEDFSLPANLSQSFHRLYHPGLIIGHHDGSQQGVGAKCCGEPFGIGQSRGIDRKLGQIEVFLLREETHGMKHRMMFRGCGHQMTTSRAVPADKPQKRKIAAFRSTGGEDDLVGLGSQQRGYPVTGIIHGCPRAAPGGMNAGGVARQGVEPRQHGIACFGTKLRGGIVIEIDHQQSL